MIENCKSHISQTFYSHMHWKRHFAVYRMEFQHLEMIDTWLQGSRFSLIVPLKRKGSWGMTAITDLRTWTDNRGWHSTYIHCRYLSLSRGREAVSTPSSVMEPLLMFTILKRAWRRLDLPAPVRPTTPIWLPTHTHTEGGREICRERKREVKRWSGSHVYTHYLFSWLCTKWNTVQS